jgi:hypothetical protein
VKQRNSTLAWAANRAIEDYCDGKPPDLDGFLDRLHDASTRLTDAEVKRTIESALAGKVA